MSIDPYGAELARHEQTIANIRADAEQMLRLTATVFLNGGAIDKHENVCAINEAGSIPALLWNGDLVADRPQTGLVMVNRNRYPITPILEDLLRQKGYVRADQATEFENAWISRDQLNTIVREWLEAA